MSLNSPVNASVPCAKTPSLCPAQFRSILFPRPQPYLASNLKQQSDPALRDPPLLAKPPYSHSPSHRLLSRQTLTAGPPPHGIVLASPPPPHPCCSRSALANPVQLRPVLAPPTSLYYTRRPPWETSTVSSPLPPQRADKCVSQRQSSHPLWPCASARSARQPAQPQRKVSASGSGPAKRRLFPSPRLGGARVLLSPFRDSAPARRKQGAPPTG